MADISACLGPAKRDDWQTPVDFYAGINELWDFDFDPCPVNPTFDGLKVEWGLRNYINPPYNANNMNLWFPKAYEEAKKGKLSVFLIPSRTSELWWHQYVMKATAIYFVHGRLTFVGAPYSAPFPSALILIDPNCMNVDIMCYRISTKGKILDRKQDLWYCQ